MQARTVFPIAVAVLQLFRIHLVRGNPVPRLCQDPARERLEKEFAAYKDLPDGAMAALYEQLTDLQLDSVPSEFRHVRNSTLTSPECPYTDGGDVKEHIKSQHRHLHKDGPLCPTHDVLTFDENRIPSILFEKRCSCQQCGRQKEHTDGSIKGCVEITYPRKVLRRVGCSNNEYIYKVVLEPTVVACGCDRRVRQPHAENARIHNPQNK